jgi:hypothetical protein
LHGVALNKDRRELSQASPANAHSLNEWHNVSALLIKK